MVKLTEEQRKILNMKKLLFCLVFIIICFANNLNAQVKTPYEKKQEEITLKYLKKMGVSISEIDRAKKADATGLTLMLLLADRLQQYQYTHGMESILLMNEWKKEIESSEKLKNEEDFRRERVKQEEEEKKIKAHQEKYEEQKRLEAKQREENRLAEIYNNSDYVAIKFQIKREFEDWILKGEFEKTIDYENRLLKKESVLDSIAYFSIQSFIFNSIENMYEKPVSLENYNADGEFYPIKITFNYNSTMDSLSVPIKDAASFKSNLENEYSSNWQEIFNFYSELRNWVFLNNNFYPKKYHLNRQKQFANLPKAGTKELEFTTEDLSLSKYFNPPYNFNAVIYEKKLDQKRAELRKLDYKKFLDDSKKYEDQGNLENALETVNIALKQFSDSTQLIKKADNLNFQINEKKRDNFIREGDQNFTSRNFGKAKNLFDKANEIRYSEDIKLKIDNVNYKLNEIKREALLLQAQDLKSLGMLTKSIETYNEANKIRQTQDITSIISEIEKSRSAALKNHYTLDSLFKLLTSDDYELFKDLVKPSQLDLIKEGYGWRYSSCETTLYKKLGAIWNPLSNEFESYSSNRNKEIWNDGLQSLLDNMIKFDQTFTIYKLFEQRIYKALLDADKKYLKVLKQNDDNEIIETVIKTEN